MREDWIEVELEQFCYVNMGQSPPSSSYNYNKEGLPFFQGKAEFTQLHPKVKKWCNAPKKVANPNDILLSVRAPVGTTNIADVKCAIGRGLASISYQPCTFYIYYYFKLIEKKLDALGTGTTFKAISGNTLKSQIIPLPPLPEQRAIVSKIEQLFSELDNAISNLKTAKDKLNIYRQAVLKKAFEGELTKEWRKQQLLNGFELPSADELLERIKTERENQYHEHLVEWKQKVKDWEANGKDGKKPGKPRKFKELPILTDKIISSLPALPKNWNWVRIDRLQEHFNYSIKAGPFGSSLKKSSYTESGYKIYGQEQVISSNPLIGNYFVNKEKYDELFSCAIKPNDILISLVGTVGKVLILPDGVADGIINPRLVKISLNLKYYSTLFFKYYFESSFLKSLYATESHGATMDIINLGIIQDLPYPLFSLIEQTQIVKEIEYRLSVTDKVEETIEQNLKKAEALRQSILKKAFEGKLLSKAEIELCKKQPDYEPAEKLLARIKKEKLTVT